MTGVLVVAETRAGLVRGVTHQLVGAARRLAAGPVRLLLVTGIEGVGVSDLAIDGVDEILVAASPVEHFEAHVTQAAVEAALAELSPSFVLVGHTADGLCMAPALAAANDLALVTDVFDVVRQEEHVVVRTSIYDGKVWMATTLGATGPAVLTVREGAFTGAAASAGLNSSRALDVDLGEAAQTEHLGFDDAVIDEHGLGRADVVLSIGRGTGGGTEVPRFERLAERLGAAFAVSGPMVSSGWAPSTRLVGQSGLSVAPEVYLALGISGAVQHLAGIRDATAVIAVNNDPRAAIFEVADYAVVADLHEVADALEAQL